MIDLHRRTLDALIRAQRAGDRARDGRAPRRDRARGRHRPRTATRPAAGGPADRHGAALKEQRFPFSRKVSHDAQASTRPELFIERRPRSRPRTARSSRASTRRAGEPWALVAEAHAEPTSTAPCGTRTTRSGADAWRSLSGEQAGPPAVEARRRDRRERRAHRARSRRRTTGSSTRRWSRSCGSCPTGSTTSAAPPTRCRARRSRSTGSASSTTRCASRSA